MVNEMKLKPCPFCGTLEIEPMTKHFKLDAWSFVHRCPVIGVISFDFGERDRRINQWNTRVDPQHAALVKALKALVAVDDGIDENDSYETAAQVVNDLDAAMNQARAALKEAGEL